ncbi:hypothetical protein FE241_00915 [Raoultella terrigena]|nr:hypothetical protein [Raoultella terrigena]
MLSAVIAALIRSSSLSSISTSNNICSCPGSHILLMPLPFQHFMLISTLDTEKGIFMEWLVIDVIYLGKTSHYMLILHAGTLKMMSEITSKSPIQPGDILYPVSNAMYLINKNENQRLKVTSASAFSSTQWCFLKKSC